MMANPQTLLIRASLPHPTTSCSSNDSTPAAGNWFHPTSETQFVSSAPSSKSTAPESNKQSVHPSDTERFRTTLTTSQGSHTTSPTLWTPRHSHSPMPFSSSVRSPFPPSTFPANPQPQPTSFTHLKAVRIVNAAYAFFSQPAYRTIHHAAYIKTTARLLDRVLMSMGQLPMPRYDWPSFAS